jgi:nucleoside-diphosphate-sugar epimerase
MKILITGAKGIVGKEFIKRYGNKYDIVSYDLKDGQDINNYEQLLLASEGCERIVHLAAIPKPKMGFTFPDYFKVNDVGTKNICEIASRLKIPRIVYTSSTTYYGIERGIPYKQPVTEDQLIISQSIEADELACRDIDLFYHHSKVIAEQIIACYSLFKKFEAIVLRLAPVNKVFLNTSVSFDNACLAIDLAINAPGTFWYEPFSIVDPGLPHISHEKATKMLGYNPTKPTYTPDQIH